MKFIQKWFAGICERCSAETHVREVQKLGNCFLCEGCEPSESHWHIGVCEGRDCVNNGDQHSVRWMPEANSFLCTLHRNPGYEVARYMARSK